MPLNISPDLPEDQKRILQEVNDEAERIYQEMKKKPFNPEEEMAKVSEKSNRLLGDNLGDMLERFDERFNDISLNIQCFPILQEINELTARANGRNT